MRAIVTDEKGRWTPKTFDGPNAVSDAEDYISTLPDAGSGRYDIDACIPVEHNHCDGCDCPEPKACAADEEPCVNCEWDRRLR